MNILLIYWFIGLFSHFQINDIILTWNHSPEWFNTILLYLTMILHNIIVQLVFRGMIVHYIKSQKPAPNPLACRSGFKIINLKIWGRRCEQRPQTFYYPNECKRTKLVSCAANKFETIQGTPHLPHAFPALIKTKFDHHWINHGYNHKPIRLR